MALRFSKIMVPEMSRVPGSTLPEAGIEIVVKTKLANLRNKPNSNLAHEHEDPGKSEKHKQSTKISIT